MKINKPKKPLSHNQAHLQALFDYALDAILIADDEGYYLEVNPAACQLLGYNREELLALRVWDITPEPNQHQGRKQWQLFLASGKQSGEYRLRRKDGRTIEVEYRAVAHIQPGLHLSILRDITERKRIEHTLRYQKELLQTIFDHIPVMIGLLDPDGLLNLVNQEWERVLGWSLEEARNIDFLAELYPDPAYRQKVFEFIRSASTEWSDFRVRVRDGRVIDTMWTNVRLSDGSNIGIGQDITTRKRAERELRRQSIALNAAHERLAAFSKQTLEAGENEHRRLARELHDEFAQRLATLKIRLGLIQRRIEQPGEAAPLDEELAFMDQMIKQVRDITQMLRPPLLDELGLIPALRAYTEQQTRLTGLAINLRADPPTLELPHLLEITSFRVIQEGLHNAVKHARARRIDIELRQGPSELTLSIRDDGVGFDVQAALQRAVHGESLGLLSMEERVLLAGGKIDIESAPNRGTAIQVSIPLTPKQHFIERRTQRRKRR